MSRNVLILSCVAVATLYGQSSEALPKAPGDVQPGGITYEDVAYPHPVKFLPLTMYGQDVLMAYMDVPPLGTPTGGPSSCSTA